MSDNTLIITPPNPDEFNRQGTQIVAQANELTVLDDSTFKGGGEMLTTIKTIVKNIETEFADPVKKAHEAHKSMVALRDKALLAFRQAEVIIKGKLVKYHSDQERKRQAEYRAKLKAEQEKAEAERLKKAEEAMDKGDLDKCEKILEQPAAPVAPIEVQTPAAPKIAGVSFREDWDFVIEDVDAVPRDLMVPDVQTIRGLVKRQGKACRIPGVRVFPRPGASASGR